MYDPGIDDDSGYDDLYFGRKPPNDDYDHHENKYHGDNCYDDARIKNHDGGRHYPNDDADRDLKLPINCPMTAAYPTGW